MISIKNIHANILEITAPQTLKAADLEALAPQADTLIKQFGTIRLLIDCSQFEGWEDIKALETHMSFIKSHHEHVERIACVAGQAWHHWLAATLHMFLHPEVQVFDKDKMAEAMAWIEE